MGNIHRIISRDVTIIKTNIIMAPGSVGLFFFFCSSSVVVVWCVVWSCGLARRVVLSCCRVVSCRVVLWAGVGGACVGRAEGREG